jgi:O-antigen/teichoic acid export membrane protein
MFFALIVSLYTTRVVLNILGLVDYGIFCVVAGFVSMLTFLTNTLSSTMQRFYNYERAVSGVDGERNVYAVGLIIHIGMALFILLILETVGLWYVNNVLVIPKERLLATNILYQTSSISMIIAVLQIPYTGFILSREKMDFYAFVGIVGVILRLLLVIMLPHIFYDKLIVYGFINLLISVVDIILYISYSKIKFSELKLQLSFSRKMIKDVLSFSIWNMVGTFAFIAKGQGANLLLNYFFGPIVNAARSIAYQVNNAVNGYCHNIAVSVRPQLIDAYAHNDFDRTRTLMFAESKVCFTVIAFLITPLIAETKYILHLWLGDSIPSYTSIFVVIVLMDMLINSLNIACTQVVHAVGNLRRYQIASAVINLISPVFCLGFLVMGYQPYSVFIVAMFFSCIHQAICLINANRLFPFGLILYVKQIFLPCASLISILILSSYCITMCMDSSFFRLLIIMIQDVAVTLSVGYYLLLNCKERTFIINLFKRTFHLSNGSLHNRRQI